jgi:hypothetical protein
MVTRTKNTTKSVATINAAVANYKPSNDALIIAAIVAECGCAVRGRSGNIVYVNPTADCDVESIIELLKRHATINGVIDAKYVELLKATTRETAAGTMNAAEFHDALDGIAKYKFGPGQPGFARFTTPNAQTWGHWRNASSRKSAGYPLLVFMPAGAGPGLTSRTVGVDANSVEI